MKVHKVRYVSFSVTARKSAWNSNCGTVRDIPSKIDGH